MIPGHSKTGRGVLSGVQNPFRRVLAEAWHGLFRVARALAATAVVWRAHPPHKAPAWGCRIGTPSQRTCANSCNSRRGLRRRIASRCSRPVRLRRSTSHISPRYEW